MEAGDTAVAPDPQTAECLPSNLDHRPRLVDPRRDAGQGQKNSSTTQAMEKNRPHRSGHHTPFRHSPLPGIMTTQPLESADRPREAAAVPGIHPRRDIK